MALAGFEQASGERQAAIGPVERFVFDEAPMLVYWEATRACDLACIH